MSAISGTSFAHFQRPAHDQRAVHKDSDAGLGLTSVVTDGTNTSTLQRTATPAVSVADSALPTDQVAARANKVITGPPAQQDYSRIGTNLAASGAFSVAVSQLNTINQAAATARYQQAQALVTKQL